MLPFSTDFSHTNFQMVRCICPLLSLSSLSLIFPNFPLVGLWREWRCFVILICSTYDGCCMKGKERAGSETFVVICCKLGERRRELPPKHISFAIKIFQAGRKNIYKYERIKNMKEFSKKQNANKNLPTLCHPILDRESLPLDRCFRQLSDSWTPLAGHCQFGKFLLADAHA